MAVDGVSEAQRRRLGEARFIGRIAQIAPGFWIGVAYDDPVGKNDGSLGGERFFECEQGHGGFLRPNFVTVDYNWKPNNKSGAAQRKQAALEALLREEEAAKLDTTKPRSWADIALKARRKAVLFAQSPWGLHVSLCIRDSERTPRFSLRACQVKDEAVVKGENVATTLRKFDEKQKSKQNWHLVLKAAERDRKRAAASSCKAEGSGLSSSIVRQLGTFKIYAYAPFYHVHTPPPSICQTVDGEHSAEAHCVPCFSGLITWATSGSVEVTASLLLCEVLPWCEQGCRTTLMGVTRSSTVHGVGFESVEAQP